MSLFLLILMAGIYEDTPITRNLDTDFVPGTYAEYRASQPEFADLRVTPVYGVSRGSDVMIVMEEFMSDSLDGTIFDQWIADIESEGNTVSAVEITYAYPTEIRAWFQELYADGLKGVILVGDIPAPWSCTVDDSKSNETFPSDYFYMDLDGVWEDNWIGSQKCITAPVTQHRSGFCFKEVSSAIYHMGFNNDSRTFREGWNEIIPIMQGID